MPALTSKRVLNIAAKTELTDNIYLLFDSRGTHLFLSRSLFISVLFILVHNKKYRVLVVVLAH